MNKQTLLYVNINIFQLYYIETCLFYMFWYYVFCVCYIIMYIFQIYYVSTCVFYYCIIFKNTIFILRKLKTFQLTVVSNLLTYLIYRKCICIENFNMLVHPTYRDATHPAYTPTHGATVHWAPRTYMFTLIMKSYY